MDIGFRMDIDGNASATFLGKLGAKEKEFLAAYGMEVGPDMQIFFAGEGFQQKHTFAATGQSYNAEQGKLGIKFRYVPAVSIIKNIETFANYTQSPTKYIDDRYAIINNALIFDQTLIQDRFIGLKEINAIIAGTFDVGTSGEVILSGGASNLRYNDGTGKTSMVGGIKYIQYMGDGKISVSVNNTNFSTQYSAGYESNIESIPGATWNITASQSNGPGFNDQRIMAGLSIPFGEESKPVSYVRPEHGKIGNIGENTTAYAKSMQSQYV